LRAACGEGASLSVLKASIARLAFGEKAVAEADLDRYLAGPTAVAFGADDPVVLARTLAEWGKKEHLLPFKGGLLDGQALAADAVSALAKIPPKAVLMSMVIRTIAAPLTSLLGVAQGPIRKLLGLADALAKKKSESSAAA